MRILYLSGLWFHDFWFLGYLDQTEHEVLSVRAYRSPGSPEADPRLAAFRRIRHLEAAHWFQEAKDAGEIPGLGMARRLKRLIAEFKPDILQVGWLSDSGVLAALTGFRPVLMTPYGSDILLDPHRSPEHRWKARLALRCAEAVTVDSLEVARRITRLSGFPFEKIVRFPWGIDLECFQPDAAPAGLRKRLGWEGRTVLIATRSLEPLYGTQFLIEAFPEVLRIHPDACLLVIGDGSHRISLEETAIRLGVKNAVHFQGYVPNAELQSYLVEADLYVTASLSDGTSRSLMEAFACGLPAVVTDPPAYAEWVREGVNGAVVKKGNAPDLAQGILRVLSDRDAMKRMGEAGLAMAREHFDERRNLAKLEGMYEGLRRDPTPPRLVKSPPPPLNLDSVQTTPFRYPSWKSRLAEWLVIAALYGEAQARRSPRWPSCLRWR